jgi:beta-glucanase (GH16 family)
LSNIYFDLVWWPNLVYNYMQNSTFLAAPFRFLEDRLVTNKKSVSSLIKVASMILAATCCVSVASADVSLVWSDEFNGTSLDPANWTAEFGNGCPSLCGWGNNELEFYRPQNVTVSGGNLVLTTLEQSYGGASYTSGKVHSRDKQFFLYGRFEMRAKIPTGGGMWPAFWMMPQDDVYGGWASSGEIDIMESSNGTTYVGGALHYGGSWPDNRSTSSSYSLGGANFADDFHIYAVEWEPDEIRWYVDGVLFSTRTSSQWYSDGAPGNPQAPFDQDFYIILNAAIGGNYTGCIEPECITASLPQQYLIDYVRVYQDTGNAAPDVSITAPLQGDNLSPGNITVNATASDSDGYVTKVEFYNGTTYLGEDTSAPYTFLWSSVTDGCYDLIAVASDDQGGTGSDSQSITVGSGCGQEPFPGSPFMLPTKIEAEDFDLGGEGIAYHDAYGGNQGGQYRTTEDVDIENCYDTGGGYSVGWIVTDEWMEYTVNVPVAGEYTIETRVSSLSAGGVFHLEFNGVDKTGDITAPVTGGWQTWTSVPTTVTLSAGIQVMRFVATTSGFNLNHFDILRDLSAVPPDNSGPRLTCWPNPFNAHVSLRLAGVNDGAQEIVIHDAKGRAVRHLNDEAVGGELTLSWNGCDDAGRSLPSGVYFARTTGQKQAKTRLVLVK